MHALTVRVGSPVIERQEPRKRGVRLSDLDRGLVYRIAFIGRRWEVLGPEGAPDAGGASGQGGSVGESAEGARTTGAPGPRHVAPADPPD
jgi:hypothetical protein